ncbi:MAG: NosD domain-containing protein, partial [Verrucomicrobiales bacterium]
MYNTIIRRGFAASILTLGLMTIAPTIAEARSSNSRAGNTWNITRPGNYKLYRNITVREGDAIVISASNVTLDLNGRTVSTNDRGTGRGVVIESGKDVTVRNGRISGFNTNVAISGAENAQVSNLQITGDGLAPDGGPSEIGVLVLNSRACTLRSNTISSVNLGIFVRGGGSTGNRIEGNVLVGGRTDASNIFGICYNPAPDEGSAGPSGDSIYNNHIARFNYAISVSAGSNANSFVDNTLSSFTGPFRDPDSFGTNAEFDNTSTII